MNPIRRIGFMRRKRELQEEIEAHLQMAIADRVARGEAEQAARQAAAREFGNVPLVQDVTAGAWGTKLLDELLADFRFAVRQFRRNLGFSALSIMVLSIGIAFSTMMFGVLDATLLKPLPYHEPSRLLALYESTPVGARFHLSYEDFKDWNQQNGTFESLSIYSPARVSTQTANGLEHVPIAYVNDGFFRTLGVSPILGRDFRPGEERPQAERTVILSNRAWRDRFGKDSSVLGRTVVLNGQAFQVIGVLGPDFQFAPAGSADYWVTVHGLCGEANRRCHAFYGIGRLKPGVSQIQALGDLQRIAQRIAINFPTTNGDRGSTVAPLTEIILGNYQPTLVALSTGAALLLVIAYVNVAGLLLVRAQSRRREMAIRDALGAAVVRQVRQFATEAVLLGLLSLLIGTSIAVGAVSFLPRMIPSGLKANLPALEMLHPSSTMFLFALGASLIAILFLAVTPLAVFFTGELREDLHQSGRHSTSTSWRQFGSRFVVGEFAISVLLLLSAALLARSYYKLQHVDLGISPQGLAVVHLELSDKLNDAETVGTVRRIVSSVLTLPGVKGAGVSYGIATGGSDNYGHFRVPGRRYSGQGDEANFLDASVGYFETVQASLLEGRFFTAADASNHQWVAIINETMAKHLFPGENPIGRRIVSEYSLNHPLEIVGIVHDIQEQGIDGEPKNVVYGSFEQAPESSLFLTVRTDSRGDEILPTLVQSAVHAAPAAIVDEPETMDQMINDTPTSYLHRSAAWLAIAFAAIAILLTSAGLYGVISYSVAQRNREIAVRLAVGASLHSIYRLVYQEAFRLVLFGATVGLLFSFPAISLLRSMLFGVKPWDLWTVVVVIIGLSLAALAACSVPAIQATRVSPMEVLKSE